MTTALDLIRESLEELGVLGIGEVPDATQAAHGLTYLNDLLESLSNEGLMVYAQSQDSLTLTGASTYTVGTGGTFNISRPVNLSSAFFRLNNIDYPVRVLTQEEYDSISNKTVTGSIIQYVYLNPAYPLATLYMYPIVSSGTLFVDTSKPLTSLPLLTTALSFPVGYKAALRSLLADSMMSKYGKQRPKITADATRLKAWLKRVNHKPRVMGTDAPVTNRRSTYIDLGY